MPHGRRFTTVHRTHSVPQVLAYVVNEYDSTVTPADLTTDTEDPPIPVGLKPDALAV
jgi:DNA-binding beta-propeller fold protein YncE